MNKPFVRAAAAALAPVLPAGALWCTTLAHAADGAPAPAGQTLGTVVVSATRSEQPLTDVIADVTVIDRDAIERSGAAAVADVLARVPGITMVRNGGPGTTTSVYVRGAESRFTAVFIDGVRVDSQSTGGATWNAIPLSQVERIEVLRGPAAAIYGSDAIAGVVQIVTRQGEEGFLPSVRVGAGNQDTQTLGVALRGGAQGWHYALGLGKERSEGFNARLAGNPDRDGYRNDHFSGRLGWRLAPGHHVEVTLLDSRQRADYDGYVPGVDDQSRHRLRTAGLHWSAHWSDAWSTRASVTRGTDRYETTPSPYLTQTDVTTTLLRNEWRLGDGWLTADLERREDALRNASTTPARTNRHQNALALGYGWRSGPHSLQVNARHDDDSEFGGQSTGLVAYGYALSRTVRVTASTGTAFRVPTLFQRFSIYGTPDLRAEKARNLEAGVHWQSGQGRLSVVAYRNRVRDLIDYVSGPGPCVNGVGVYAGCYGNVGRARYAGLTLSGGTRVGAVNLGAAWDVMRPKNEQTDMWLARRPRSRATVTADALWSGWRLGGEMQLVGARYNDAANTQRLPGYALLNLTAERPVGRDWRLLARIDNATDRAYQLVQGYATAGRTVFVGLSWAPR